MFGLSFAKLMDIPPMWLLGFAIAVWGIGQAMPVSVGLTSLGTALVAVGLGLIVLAAWQFRQHQTTIIPHLNAQSLITTGVFKFSRNPIYLADAVILAGLCLRWDAPVGLVQVVPFILVIQRRFILAEEARLRAAFGADFEAYAQKTRRWL